jgi:hypothetical protein
MGFLLQLIKWEELLNSDREQYCYRINMKCDISLFNINDLQTTQIQNILIITYKDKTYIVVANKFLVDNEIKNKLDNLIFFMQTYGSYPDNVEYIFLGDYLVNDKIFSGEIDKILKYCQLL